MFAIAILGSQQIIIKTPLSEFQCFNIKNDQVALDDL